MSLRKNSGVTDAMQPVFVFVVAVEFRLHHPPKCRDVPPPYPHPTRSGTGVHPQWRGSSIEGATHSHTTHTHTPHALPKGILTHTVTHTHQIQEVYIQQWLMSSLAHTSTTTPHKIRSYTPMLSNARARTHPHCVFCCPVALWPCGLTLCHMRMSSYPTLVSDKKKHPTLQCTHAHTSAFTTNRAMSKASPPPLLCTVH